MSQFRPTPASAGPAPIPGSRPSRGPRPLPHPGGSRGWFSPASETQVLDARDLGQGAETWFARLMRGPAELRGRLKDLLHQDIARTPNHARTRERIAELLGTSAGEIKKKVAADDARHLGAHELPAFVAVLGDEVLHEVCAACGGVFLRLPEQSPRDTEESLLDLLLAAQDAAGELASALRRARQRQHLAESTITVEEQQAIEAAGLATLRAYQALMLAVGAACGGGR